MDNSIDPSVITLVSVVAAAIVSIMSVFIPTLVDWLKTKREKRTKQAEHVNETALDLLRNLAPFRHTVYDDIVISSARDPVKLHTDLQVSHYAWERAVWPHLGDKEREQVKELRKTFETTQDPSEYAKQLQELTSKILTICYIASQKVDSG